MVIIHSINDVSSSCSNVSKNNYCVSRFNREEKKVTSSSVFPIRVLKHYELTLLNYTASGQRVSILSKLRLCLGWAYYWWVSAVDRKKPKTQYSRPPDIHEVDRSKSCQDRLYANKKKKKKIKTNREWITNSIYHER